VGIYNKIVEHIILPTGDALLGTNYMRDLRRFRSLQYLSKEEIDALQSKALQQLLLHATKNIDYYKQLNIEAVADPFKWLKKFPLLTKEVIRNNNTGLVLNNDINNLVKETSSGSSGVQSTIYMSKKESSSVLAAQTLLWEWAGFRLGSHILQLGMTLDRGTIKKSKDYLLNTVYQQAFSLDNSTIVNVLKGLKNPAYFGGYASGLYTYAKAAMEEGIDNIHFKSVISWGDKMFPHYRKTIEQAFNTKVFDIYGSTEGLVIAGQCEFGNYHILSPHVYLELLDGEGREVAPGENGFVVVTRLDAYKMPLIRYYLGDIAVKKEHNEMCGCGRHLNMLEKIVGRDTDIIITPGGKQLIVHFFTGIFEHFSEVIQFRVIQHTQSDIEIELIPGESFTSDTVNSIEKIIHKKAVEVFPIKFTIVKEILPTASGKPQIIESKLAKKLV